MYSQTHLSNLSSQLVQLVDWRFCPFGALRLVAAGVAAIAGRYFVTLRARGRSFTARLSGGASERGSWFHAFGKKARHATLPRNSESMAEAVCSGETLYSPLCRALLKAFTFSCRTSGRLLTCAASAATRAWSMESSA